MKKKYIGMLLAWLCGVMTLSAQTGVSGRGINADTNEPVVGANIRVDHSLTGDVTNTRGEFTISNLPEGTHTLNVSHVNYTTEAREVRSGETDIVIRMRESMVQLGQVVVTGTGTHHLMKNSPVPVSVITSRELSNAGIATLDEALQKLTPSFSNMTNGMGTTLSLNGLPEKYFVFLENGRRMGGDNTYERIDVSRIKRIEILSGASSALYGTNAVGGVVNIITNDVKHAVNLSSDTRYTSHGRFTQSLAADVNTGRFGSYTSYRRSQAESWQLSPYERNKKDSLVETKKVASAGFHSDNVNQRFTYDATDRLSTSATSRVGPLQRTITTSSTAPIPGAQASNTSSHPMPTSRRTIRPTSFRLATTSSTQARRTKPNQATSWCANARAISRPT